jgi:thiamine transport system substrate-binding protein
MKGAILLSLVLVLVVTAGCQATPVATTTPDVPQTLTVMTHDSFDASQEVIAQFEAETGATVRILKSGDTGAALNQAILSKEAPLADVFYGVDNTFLSRAIKADIFLPYTSPILADIPDTLELDSEHRLNPVDFGDVCLNYDKAWFREKGQSPPTRLEDLTEPEMKELLVVQNPATSSPGLALLMATVGHFGEDGYRDFWAKLRANDVLVTGGWEDAYWGHFSAASDGDRPIVVSYATSPAAEVYFSEGAYAEPPTGNVLGDGACFRQIEFVGILKGTANQDLAEQWVDFMLSPTFQADIPLHMWVFPANPNAELPEVFQFAETPARPALVSPEAIDQNREKWIEAWTETVLR